MQSQRQKTKKKHIVAASQTKNGKAVSPRPFCSKEVANTNIRGIITATNHIMERFRGEIEQRQFPEFGNSLFGGDSGSCIFNTGNLIRSSVMAHRLRKFERPNPAVTHRLKAECAAKWITFERDHIQSWKWDAVSLQTRSVCYVAKDKFPFSKQEYLYQLRHAEIKLTGGETFVTSQGDVSTFSKLKMVATHWTVTVDAISAGANLVGSNRALNRCLLANWFSKRSNKQKRKDIRYATVILKREESEITQTNIVTILARDILWAGTPLDNPLITYGSRGSSVYKNSTARRFINIECFINVIGQNLEAQALRALIKRHYGVDLDKAQKVHVAMLLRCVTTGDFSNASDSVILEALKRVTPSWLINRYELWRSEFCLINEFDGNPSSYYEIKKLSSMGCGFTFEAMTLFLLQITRQFDPSSLVYGDDVMIFNSSWDRIASALGELGWIVNQKKTYSDLPLKESCGGFLLYDKYIRSYDFTWCATILDAVNTVNKLGRICRHHYYDGTDFALIAIRYYLDLLALYPALMTGPALPPFSDLPSWVEHVQWDKQHRRSKMVGKQRNRRDTQIQHLASTLQYGRNSICYTLTWEPAKVTRVKAYKIVKSVNLLYHYMYAGRVVPALMRVEELQYKPVETLVTPGGIQHRISKIRLDQTKGH